MGIERRGDLSGGRGGCKEHSDAEQVFRFSYAEETGTLCGSVSIDRVSKPLVVLEDTVFADKGIVGIRGFCSVTVMMGENPEDRTVLRSFCVEVLTSDE